MAVWLTREKKGFRLGHSRDEAFGDSDRGLAYFAQKGCTRVDGNGLLSDDEIPMNTHYHLFLKHGFVLREGGARTTMNRDLPVGHFSAHDLQWLFWTAKDHYVIKPTIDRIELAFSLGMDYEFEPKEHMSRAVAASLYNDVTYLQRSKRFHERKVIVKALAQRPGTPVYDLRPFSLAGFPTLLTSHRPGFKIHDAATEWVDAGRGFPVRIEQ